MESSELKQIFEDIRSLTYDGVGVTRASYGPGEQLAIDYLIRVAVKHGLAHTTDRAGNVVFHLQSFNQRPNQKYVLCGSHADSVAQGGNYDGLAGVVAGLACLARFRLQHPMAAVQVICFRGEESAWFGKAYKGSSALLGKLCPQDMDLRISSGKTLRESLQAVSADVAAIERQEVLIDLQNVVAYLELHIEQGPVLVSKNIPVGIVTGIRGNIRHVSLQLTGQAGHAGAVPVELRKDAVFAAADLLSHTEMLWHSMLQEGHDLVVTCGMLATQPPAHALSRIADDVRFSFEARSLHASTLDLFYARFLSLCSARLGPRDVSMTLDRRIDTAPAIMDASLTHRLERIADNQRIPFALLPSGAGHDAAVFAAASVSSAMIFVRNEHGSHNPAEAMDLPDFELATDLMYYTLLELSQTIT